MKGNLALFVLLLPLQALLAQSKVLSNAAPAPVSAIGVLGYNSHGVPGVTVTRADGTTAFTRMDIPGAARPAAAATVAVAPVANTALPVTATAKTAAATPATAGPPAKNTGPAISGPAPQALQVLITDHLQPPGHH